MKTLKSTFSTGVAGGKNVTRIEESMKENVSPPNCEFKLKKEAKLHTIHYPSIQMHNLIFLHITHQGTFPLAHFAKIILIQNFTHQGIFPLAHVVDVDYNDFDPSGSEERKER